MKEKQNRRKKAKFSLLLLSCVVLLLGEPFALTSFAEEITLWESIEDTEESPSENEETQTVEEDEDNEDLLEEEELSAQESRIEQEKVYLLQAMDQLEEWGLSPIAIWSEVTGNDEIMELVGIVKEGVSEVAEDAVQELGESAQEAIENADEGIAGDVADNLEEVANEQTKKVKQGLIEQIREWINSFFDGIVE